MPSTQVMTFSGRFVRSLIHFAIRQGVAPEALYALTGLDDEALQDESLRVPAKVYNAVANAAVAQGKDPSFGFHFGQYLNLSTAGLIVQISQTSGTVREALQHTCDFANLGCQAIPLRLEEGTSEARMYLSPHPEWEATAPEPVRHTAEGMLAFMWRAFRSLTLQQYPLHAVWVKGPANGREAEFAEVFGIPVLFDQPEYAIFFKPEHVDAPVATRDFRLLQLLVQHAQQKLAELQANQAFVDTVRDAMLNLMAPEFPTLEQVADMLHLSVRTLQRRLGEEGTTYKALLDELRQTFAQRYLADKELSVSEVAYLLSYGEVSAFSRSFRRWTGQSPVQFRKTMAR